jgi:hypothetical protein
VLNKIVGFNPVVWLKDARRMRWLVAQYASKNQREEDGKHIDVVLMPWLGTNVPWFSLAMGLFLAARGNKVRFVIDDLPFGKGGVGYFLMISTIKSVVKLLERQYEVVKLSSNLSEVSLSEYEEDFINKKAVLNAVWALRGEMKKDGRDAYISRSIIQLRRSYRAILKRLDDPSVDVIFVPGGVWGASSIWVELSRSKGKRIASYDAGPGVLLLATNGIAAQLQDIPKAFSLLKEHVSVHGGHEFILKEANEEMNRRRLGADKFSSQIGNSREVDSGLKGAVLLALNSSWDSAALGLHAVFDDSTQWVVETTKYLLEETQVPVIVRQHPVERLELARSSDNYRNLLAREFGDNPRLHFIAADDPVNSYDLLDMVAAVVVYTSTIGIEAAIRGKVVVTASNSYYANLGFVYKADSLSQYQKVLLDAARGACVISPKMRDDALYCYYLTQCCNWVFSSFNPNGFSDWSSKGLDELSKDEKVELVVRAIEQGLPVAYLAHLVKSGVV